MPRMADGESGESRSRSRTPSPRRPGAAGSRIEADIRHLQANHHYLAFTRLAFARLVREIQRDFTSEPYRWSSEALMVFQIAAEEYLMFLYGDAYLATHHRRRVTLTAEDVRLVRRLREPHCWREPR